jgi:mevalonate kinase
MQAVHLPSKTFTANGKILLTGEYYILDGAVGLALPTVRYGQTLTVTPTQHSGLIHWTALDVTGEVWLDATLQYTDDTVRSANQIEPAHLLSQMIRTLKQLNPAFLSDTQQGYTVTTTLSFNRAWGLGTSSTLTYLLAAWAEVSAYRLNELSFGSSGYDVACAGCMRPIFYQKTATMQSPLITDADFQRSTEQPTAGSFYQQLYFVYLGKKQNSREGIAHYRQLPLAERQKNAEIVTAYTQQIAQATTLSDFETQLHRHEDFIADTLRLVRAQTLYFNDFWGVIKSLGAWGGDFVLATSNKTSAETHAYFHQKGFDTVLTYQELIG